MTYSTDDLEDYRNQGQQDDYFDQDLAIAGHVSNPHTVPAEVQNQGQQDDYFDADLAASDRSTQPES